VGGINIADGGGEASQVGGMVVHASAPHGQVCLQPGVRALKR